MMNTKFLTLAALMAGAMALPIAAANAESYGAKSKTTSNTSVSFTKADTDKSGTLSESEYGKMADASQSFKTLDTNGDDVLTMSELKTPAVATGAGSSTTSSAGMGTGAANDAGLSASGNAGTDNSGSGMNGRQ